MYSHLFPLFHFSLSPALIIALHPIFILSRVDREYYTVTRRYGFYLLVVKTIFYE